MKIILNSDTQIVDQIKAGLKASGGYCPCRIKRDETTKCMCKEFREQTTPGECHCGLYVKVK